MADNRYCYPDSDVLINKLNIKDKETLFQAEKKFTFVRIQELQQHPITGKFDFLHLKKIHKYIFQDIYQWAGEIRTVEIGKGNLFCTTPCIQSYGESVFNKYYAQCEQKSFDKADFSLLYDIFKEAVTPIDDYIEKSTHLKILTSDDLKIGLDDSQHYDYYTSSEVDNIEKYNSFYKEKAQDNLQKVNQ